MIDTLGQIKQTNIHNHGEISKKIPLLKNWKNKNMKYELEEWRGNDLEERTRKKRKQMSGLIWCSFPFYSCLARFNTNRWPNDQDTLRFSQTWQYALPLKISLKDQQYYLKIRLNHDYVWLSIIKINFLKYIHYSIFQLVQHKWYSYHYSECTLGLPSLSTEQVLQTTFLLIS